MVIYQNSFFLSFMWEVSVANFFYAFVRYTLVWHERFQEKLYNRVNLSLRAQLQLRLADVG